MDERELLEEQITVSRKEPTIGTVVIMELVCNAVAALDEAGAHPEEFLKRLTRLQAAFASPFKAMSNTSLTANMHLLRITFPTGKEDVTQAKTALRAYLRAMENVERLSGEVLPDSSVPLTLTAGMDSGTVFLYANEPFGATANLVDLLASEAQKTGMALIMGSSLFKAINHDTCLEIIPRTIRVPGVVGGNLEVVVLTKRHIRMLTGQL